jgi:uncharacterized membrane protein YgcG
MFERCAANPVPHARSPVMERGAWGPRHQQLQRQQRPIELFPPALDIPPPEPLVSRAHSQEQQMLHNQQLYKRGRGKGKEQAQVVYMCPRKKRKSPLNQVDAGAEEEGGGGEGEGGGGPMASPSARASSTGTGSSEGGGAKLKIQVCRMRSRSRLPRRRVVCSVRLCVLCS